PATIRLRSKTSRKIVMWVSRLEGSQLLVDVAMGHAGGEAFFFEGLLQPFRHHYRAVLSPGAAECDGQVAFSLVNIVGNQIGEQSLHAAQKFPRLWKRFDIPANFL